MNVLPARRRWGSVGAYVLAGGAGRRMGGPKAALVLAGETLLERQIRLLRAEFRPLAVVGYAGEHAAPGMSVLEDEFRGRGPLAGIYTGLCHARSEFNLFVACDLPFLDRRLCDFLRRRALESEADVTVPESPGGRLQPLCAIYRRRLRGVVGAQLAAGRNKVDAFFPRVRTEKIPWAEIASRGFSPRIFDNMNTREDYQQAVLRLAEEAPAQERAS
jgi:molybdopterin-guanine dinucleotide biosynthesis protein A